MSIIRVGGGRRKGNKVPAVPALDRIGSVGHGKTGASICANVTARAGSGKRKKSSRGSANASKSGVASYGQRKTKCPKCGASLRITNLARHIRKVHPVRTPVSPLALGAAQVDAGVSVRSASRKRRRRKRVDRSMKAGPVSLRGGSRDNGGPQ
jgi:hypothetical protein